MTGFALQRHAFSFGPRLFGAALTGVAACPFATPAQAQFVYTTVDFGTSGTFSPAPRQQHRRKLRDPGWPDGGLLYNIATLRAVGSYKTAASTPFD